MWQKNPSTVDNLWETLDAVLVFYAIGYPLHGKSMGLLPHWFSTYR